MELDDSGDPQPDQKLVIQIRDSLFSCLERSLDSDEERSWTIDRVPHNWRTVHNNAFDPEMLSIGPVNNPDEMKLSWSIGLIDVNHRVLGMEEHKARFLNRFLGRKLECRTRIGGDMSGTTEGERPSNDRKREEDDDGGLMAKAVCLDDLVNAMLILVPATRACYPKSLEDRRYFSDSNLVKMMVLDGYFVVELLRLYYHHLHTESTGGVAIVDDPIFANPLILTTLRRDLLLLENQLPFFVLEKMYELINKMNGIDHQQTVPLEELAVTFFDPLLSQLDAVSKLHGKKPKALHLLEFFHSTFLQPVSDKVQKKGESRVNQRLKPGGSIAGLVSHFASELQEAGVKFKKRKHHDLLDIEFDHRTLRVPPLSINDHTISLLLNFVAFELSVNHPKPYFTHYLMFWNSLINSTLDVRVLHKHGIINPLKSDEEVFKLLMKCREFILDRDLGYLADDIKEANDYCERYSESKSLVWWRSLIRERFSSPWTCLSLFAAIILLLLTLLQTFNTVCPYYRPH